MTSSPSGARPDVSRPRVADLPLRGPAGPLRTRVHWPPSAGRHGPPPLLVFLPSDPDDELPVSVAASAGVVVLAVTDGRAQRQPDAAALVEATTATQWAADHAGELGADPRRVLVGGEGRGAWLAAGVALQAREDRWPALVRQLLVLPAAPRDPAGPTAAELVSPHRTPSLTGVAPAIILTVGDGQPAIEACRYVSRLRSDGVGVDDVHHRGPAAAAVPRLAGVLRRALAVTEGPRP